MTKISTVEDAVADIRDGQSVASVGVIGWLTPDAVLAALADRFERSGGPRDLTFFFPCGTGDSIGIAGMDHVARPGLMKRIVSGSYINPRNPETGERPRLMDLIHRDAIEAYSWPIGASMHWLREVARRSPGYLTRIGLDTYIDPAHGGGALTARATDPLVERTEFRGRDYLFYPAWDLDVGIIRATSADPHGNLSFEDEPLLSSSIALAMAVKACGGRVIAQVARVVPPRSRPAGQVKLPGALVDAVVVAEDQMMGTDLAYDASYLVPESFTADRLAPLPLGADKVIARRAAQEVRPGEVTIFGFGASSDVPLAMSEDGCFEDDGILDYCFTTEHGSFGGVVMPGWQFSANIGPEALIDGVSQFDYIDGGNCELAVLSFAEFDAQANVNVSRFGSSNPGAGGFIDIAANARRLVFAGTLTTGGLELGFPGDGIRIEREGKVHKLVESVREVTYRVGRGVAEGQSALLITERAVFDVTPDGLVLREIAPGVDVREDVLAQMGFAPVRIADPLVEMDRRLFAEPVATTPGA